MSKLDDFVAQLTNLIEDLSSNEAATFKITTNEEQAELCAYSKIDLGGDSIQYLSEQHPTLASYSAKIACTSSANRKALLLFLTEAL